MAAAGVPTAARGDRRQPGPPRRRARRLRARPTWSRTTAWPPARAWSSPTTSTPRAPTPCACWTAGTRCCSRRTSTGRRCRCSASSTAPTVVPLLPAQDFKRVGDDDTGPNTGGMGAYAPLPWAPPGLVDEIVARVVAPVAAELVAPRHAVLRPALRRPGADVDAARRSSSSTAGSATRRPRSSSRCCGRRWPGCCTRPRPERWREQPPLDWRDGAAVTVVVAADNYPGTPRLGDVVTGAEGEGVLHAGTRRRDDGAVVSAGGRVLSVVGTGAGPGRGPRRRVPAAGEASGSPARTTAPTSRCAPSRARSPVPSAG